MKSMKSKEHKVFVATACIMAIILAAVAGPFATILGILFFLILKLLKFLDVY